MWNVGVVTRVAPLLPFNTTEEGTFQMKKTNSPQLETLKRLATRIQAGEFPTLETLAADCGYVPAEVELVLGELVKLGLITPAQRPGPKAKPAATKRTLWKGLKHVNS